MTELPSARPSPLAAVRPAVWWWFLASLGVYAFTRLFDLEGFPIYFFSDEAVHTVLFRSLQSNHWHATVEPRELLPAYFLNGRTFNLSLSVYLQGLAAMIGGQSVVTVRITSVLASVSGAVALAMTLRRFAAVREWWSVVAFLTVIPCWFLHSRTGFETVLMVSGYCWFFYFYLRYREDGPRWIFPAMLAGAWVFYSYAPGQGIMLITGLLLLASDFRYHWRYRPWVIAGTAFGLALAFPYVRFRLLHREMLSDHLRLLNSYWASDLATTAKLKIFLSNYLQGFSPRYWFLREEEVSIRHIVPYYAHLPIFILPIVLVGGLNCVVSWRSPLSRLILVSVVAMPFSTAMVASGITRMLTVVVPFSLCAALGFEQLLWRLQSAGLRLFTRWAAFALLAINGGLMLELALVAGPLFKTNYGLYGMQWGSQALFRDLIPRYLKSDPLAHVVIMHTSFNNTDVFPAFFEWMDQDRVSFGAVDDIRSGSVLPEPADLILLEATDLKALVTFPNVEKFVMREKVSFPDGRDGFVLGHILLRTGFADKIRAQPSFPVRPANSRLLADGVVFSAVATGIESGKAADLFTLNGPGLKSQPGVPINLTIHFHQPVSPRSIRIIADPTSFPTTAISIWAQRQGITVAQLGPQHDTAAAELTFRGEMTDEIRVELSRWPGQKVRLSYVQLRFSTSSGEAEK